MKFYLAGPYPQKNYIKEVAAILHGINAQYEINSSWLYGSSGAPVEYSAKDFAEVVESDVFVMFNEEDYRHESSGGMHTELGFALAAGLEIHVIGDDFTGPGCGVNTFVSLAYQYHDTFEGFLEYFRDTDIQVQLHEEGLLK